MQLPPDQTGFKHNRLWLRELFTCLVGSALMLSLGHGAESIRSGEMHFQRVPAEYWPHRLQTLHALGVNSVSSYVFWSQHEPTPGRFEWRGQGDVARFCRLAQAEGLRVVLRPGPYVCGEADFGGLPGWLLADPNMHVRSRHPEFIGAVRRYFQALGEQVAGLQVTRGGPIAMIQVENEYDGFDADGGYVAETCSALREAGFEVPLYTSEMGGTMRPSPVPGLIRGVGFSAGTDHAFASLRRISPDGPLFCSELYTGWFDTWGYASSSGSGPDQVTNTLAQVIARGGWFNLYMAHGGTSFGFLAGANDLPYRPNVTSYDYGAPLDEAGRPTPKFHAIREILQRQLPAGQKLPEVPAPIPTVAIPSFQLRERASLRQLLTAPLRALRPVPMERLKEVRSEMLATLQSPDAPAGANTNVPALPAQTLNGHGCVWYRTQLPPGRAQELLVTHARDYLQAWLDGKYLGTIDRTRQQQSLWVPDRGETQTLDLCVEAMGHVNFGSGLGDRKGITERVELRDDFGRREVLDWEIVPLPLEADGLGRLVFEKMPPGAAVGAEPDPSVYRATFHLERNGDTFLDLRTWTKGMVWVNGHNLGRFWNRGPQQTLYVPGEWMQKGRNELLIVDLVGPAEPKVAGLPDPIRNEVNLAATGRVHQKPGAQLRLTGLSPQVSGIWDAGKAWQTRRFGEVRGRYICFEALNSHSNDGYSTCAELQLLGPTGRELPKTGWKIVYASSEEAAGEDGGADRILDGVAGTFWHSRWQGLKEPPPHQVVIDLGRVEAISGITYLPRQDQDHGRIREFRLYASEKAFPGIE